LSRSIPSILASICLALALSALFGGALTPSGADEPVGGSSDGSSPMRFTLYADGSTETCASACRPLIAASGMITADTARQFTAFVRDNALQAGAAHPAGQPGATVVLESDGGSVLGAIELGRAIRRFGFATTVGRVAERRVTAFMKYGETTAARADCQSMCTFVLLGGAQRRVPPDARVLVHQIWLGDRREDAVASNYTAEDLVVVQRDIGSILQYTIEMGGDPELVELSLRVPPWEPMRALTRDEIRRTKLDLDVEIPTVPMAVKTAAGPTLPDDEPSSLLPANGRGWTTTQRGGQPVLARSHPLTLEGERIGTFSLLVSCGAAPDTFTLTYRELRSGPADRGLPRSITQVALVLDEHLQPFKITSSEKKMHGGELESVATTVLPTRLVRTLSSDNPASMTLETDSVGNPRTTIRIGNVGFGRGLREVERSCREPQRARGEARAQAQIQ
jgi:hypothetical protein